MDLLRGVEGAFVGAVAPIWHILYFQRQEDGRRFLMSYLGLLTESIWKTKTRSLKDNSGGISIFIGPGT